MEPGRLVNGGSMVIYVDFMMGQWGCYGCYGELRGDLLNTWNYQKMLFLKIVLGKWVASHPPRKYWHI